MSRNFLVVDPEEGLDVLRGLASSVRVQILKLLHVTGPLNVNDIADKLDLPQSTVSSNVKILEKAGLIRTESQTARKGNQKICHSPFDEILVLFKEDISPLRDNTIEVSMPLGLYTSCDVSSPCGLCSSEGIIGLLDVPDTFLDPDRMKAGLMWFTRGFIEYQFPTLLILWFALAAFLTSLVAIFIPGFDLLQMFVFVFSTKRATVCKTGPCRCMRLLSVLSALQTNLSIFVICWVSLHSTQPTFI